MAMQDKANALYVVPATAGTALTTTGFNSVTFAFSNAAEAEVKLEHSEDGVTYTTVPGRDLVVPGQDTLSTVAPGAPVPTGDTSGNITFAINAGTNGLNKVGYLGGLMYVRIATDDVLANLVCIMGDAVINPVGYSA